MKGKRKKAVYKQNGKYKDARASLPYWVALGIMRLSVQQVMAVAVGTVSISVAFGVMIGLFQHLFSYL